LTLPRVAVYGEPVELSAVLNDIVKKITSYKNARKIVLFGSRARDENRPESDIDVAIIDPDWTRRDIALVHDRLEEEVRTPLKIDLLAYHLVSKEELRSRILAEGKVLYERTAHQLP
jgi:predicted nucleotidyltransferase